MRVMFQSGGGFASAESLFVAIWSGHFFVIDGSCRYYAQDNPAHPIVSGTLTPPEVTQLGADIAWFQLASWGSHHPPICADGPGAALGIRGVELVCGGAPQIGCGCDETAPAGLQEAQNNAELWLARLVAQGTPLTDPILAKAYARDATATADPWPLARNLASIPNLIADAQSFDQYARIEDPTEASQLRQLRSAHPEIARTATHEIDVRDAGRDYALYLRDEIPQTDVRAIEALIASWRQK